MLSAGNTTQTSSLRHLATVYYKKTSLDNLWKMLRFETAAMPDILPERSGKTIQWFRYSTLSANTTPSAEGVAGAGIQMDSTTISATVAEYSDHVTGSKMLQKTAIDPIADNFAKHLGYRAGLSRDTICRIELDSNVGSVTVNTAGAAGSSTDLRRAKFLLEGQDVLPRIDQDFLCLIHPYALYDVMSSDDFVDVVKYANPQTFIQGEIGKVEGCRLLKTTNVGDDGTAAPLKKYYTYVIGEGAFGACTLAGSPGAAPVDPSKSMYQVNVVPGKISEANPEGKVGFLVSYWMAFVAKTLDTTVYRYKIIPMDSSII
jgi:N4-gp56 family major capsid protein